MASLILYVLALVLAVNTANSLTCYNCNSKNSSRCSWGVTSFTFPTEECDPPKFSNVYVPPKCYKLTAKSKEGSEYIARGCTNTPAVACEALASTAGWISGLSSPDPQTVSDIRCDTCETDKCNSATRITGFTLLGLLLAAGAFLF